MVILFTTDCPRCKILEEKLAQKQVDFTESHDVEEIINQGFQAAPVLKVDDRYLDFGAAVKWVNSL